MRGGDIWVRRDARGHPFEHTYSSLLGRDDARLVVGTVDGRVAGFAAAEVEALADGTRHGVVTDLYVEPQSRRRGLGERMLGALVEMCDVQGCRGVDAGALPGDRATKSFFESMGFVARSLVMHKASTASPAPAARPGPE